MIKGILAVILAVALVGCVQRAVHEHDIPEQVVDFAMDNVWRIQVGNGAGTAFSISEEYALTACHVVEGGIQAEKTVFLTNLRDTKVVEMDAISCNAETDIAILKWKSGSKLNSTFQGFHPRPMKIGRTMYGAGYPLGGKLMLNSGYVDDDVPSDIAGGSTNQYYTTAQIVPGDSGSPAIVLYDGKPLVVGIRRAVPIVQISWTNLDLGSHMAMTVPWKEIKIELEKHT